MSCVFSVFGMDILLYNLPDHRACKTPLRNNRHSSNLQQTFNCNTGSKPGSQDPKTSYGVMLGTCHHGGELGTGSLGLGRPYRVHLNKMGLCPEFL